MMTAIIAFAVYRVQSEKLFVDTFRLRLDALNNCIDAAHARMTEIQEYRLSSAVQPETTTLRRFWDAERAARPLFGKEVHVSLKRLEAALRDFDIAYVEMIEAHYDTDGSRIEKFNLKNKAQFKVFNMIEQLARATEPYVSLGSRGLGMRQRLFTTARQAVFRLKKT
ncbi:hypothetical protein [Sphingobium abikonense]|uniref:hypothetical protein n=1 Tax=Sphingobium abikonense TaxID=86193 RepID=UPI00355AC131